MLMMVRAGVAQGARADETISRVRYWLVNSGTSEEPWGGDLHARYRAWNDEHGDVQMFPRRPRTMGPGDVLIHRAVGSDGNRLIAVGEVRSMPEPSGHDRWPWQVRRRLVHVCRHVTDAPGIADIGQSPAGLRVFKEIDERSGSEAVRLVAERAQRLEHVPSTGDGASPR